MGSERTKGLVFGGAVLVAPFLALLYGWSAGLAVMCVTLVATTALALQAGRTAAPEMRQRLLPVAALNGFLAVLCLVVLIWQLV